MSTVTLALVGIGGYGNSYVNALLDASPADRAAAGDFRVVAAIDPSPHLCRRLDELTARVVEARERVSLKAGATPVLIKIAPDLTLNQLDEVVAIARRRKRRTRARRRTADE